MADDPIRGPMRVAVLHDHLRFIGGGERVALTLAAAPTGPSVRDRGNPGLRCLRALRELGRVRGASPSPEPLVLPHPGPDLLRPEGFVFGFPVLDPEDRSTPLDRAPPAPIRTGGPGCRGDRRE